jgi:N-acetylglucosaminyldiphosphoundecaprenol N-acetyl-beta-D-mannosaminyltransferase
MTQKVKILKMIVDVIRMEQVLEKIKYYVDRNSSAYICVSNVHMCMEVFDSDNFEKVVNQADMVVADGRPIFWAQKLLGSKTASQVRGIDLMKALCSFANNEGLKVGLYGGNSNKTLISLKKKLKKNFHELKITYAYSPPFHKLSSKEQDKIQIDIKDSDVDILFVGIGCPKQEYWMARNKENLKCVMLGVGAAFDFIVGTKKHAPRLMQYLGLEWLFRLFSEPKRLWRRYLIHNSRFLFYFLLQLLKIK